MPDKPTISFDLAEALTHFFQLPANHEAGACVVNALLTQIELTGRKPRLTGADFARLADLFELLHLPGPIEQIVKTVEPKDHRELFRREAAKSLDDIAQRTREKAEHGHAIGTAQG